MLGRVFFSLLIDLTISFSFLFFTYPFYAFSTLSIYLSERHSSDMDAEKKK